ncbi:hypothetical protein B0H10DRAFT_1777337 [Mycena sp. CBHHK59/15]|nr:hypothetical protein B0H10DRAFT_1777337 [Mycena sp. CBHHK59/15]
MPQGYTYAFLRPRCFLSVKAENITKGLLESAEDRGPYGKLALIDNALNILHAEILKKEWDEAYTLLAALTLFNEIESYWPMCDDGKRVVLTNKVYGAALVTVLRALKKDGRLDASHFPGLETTLRQAADWGESMKEISCKSDYDLVCKAIGARLFTKTAAEVASEKARLERWISSRSQEEQEAIREIIQDDEEDEEDDEEGEPPTPWYAGETVNEDTKNNDFVLSRVWKDYNEYLQKASAKSLGRR